MNTESIPEEDGNERDSAYQNAKMRAMMNRSNTVESSIQQPPVNKQKRGNRCLKFKSTFFTNTNKVLDLNQAIED